MEIILLQKVDNLGELGEKVNVKSGYGRNFLIPSGRAVPATAENMKAFEERRAELEAEAAGVLAEAQQRKQKLDDLQQIAISRKVGEEGRLFGSVGTADIAKALTEAGCEVSRKEVMLPNGAFRISGDFTVDIHLHADLNATINMSIVPEE